MPGLALAFCKVDLIFSRTPAHELFVHSTVLACLPASCLLISVFFFCLFPPLLLFPPPASLTSAAKEQGPGGLGQYLGTWLFTVLRKRPGLAAWREIGKMSGQVDVLDWWPCPHPLFLFCRFSLVLGSLLCLYIGSKCSASCHLFGSLSLLLSCSLRNGIDCTISFCQLSGTSTWY